MKQNNACVLISIKPEWCAKIANQRKTMELRKSVPRSLVGNCTEFEPFKVYIYCSNRGRPLVYGDVFRGDWYEEYTQTRGWSRSEAEKLWGVMNGKVIGEFTCDFILRWCHMANADIAEKKSLVRREDIYTYSNGKEVYGWNITDLKIYEEPKELSVFKLNRPPQSWCYVEKLRD